MKNILFTLLLLLITATSVFGQTDLLPGGVKGVDAGSDSAFLKVNGSAVGKRPTDNVYKPGGTLGLRTTDTTGVFNIVRPLSDTKFGIYLGGDQQNLWKVQKMTSATTEISGFNFTRSIFPAISTAGDNQVFTFGLNGAGGGGLDDPTKAAMYIAFENNYRNNPTDAKSFEFHNPQIFYPGGAGRRPISGYYSNDAADIRGHTGFTADFFNINDYKTNTQKVTWGFATNSVYPKGIVFSDTALIKFGLNNVGGITQRNAANTADIQLIKANSANEVVIGGANETRVVATNHLHISNTSLITGASNQILMGNTANPNRVIIEATAEILRLVKSGATYDARFDISGTDLRISNSTSNRVFNVNLGAPISSIRVTAAGLFGNGTDNPQAQGHFVSVSGNTAKMLRLQNSVGSSDVYRSNATPEGAITANEGDITLSNISSTGGLWLKKTGTGNTGWVDLGALVTESTSVGAFNNTGNSNGLSLTGTALSLHAATISTPGGVSTGQQTFTSGGGTKIFNGSGTGQVVMDGNTDNTPTGINFTQQGTDLLGVFHINSSDADNARLRFALEQDGGLVDQINVGTLNDTKGIYTRNGLYEDVTDVTTSPYTVQYGDRNIYLDGTSITVNLQAIGTLAGETKVGRVLYFFNDNATSVTIVPNGAELINDGTSLTLPANTGVTLLSVTESKWITRD